MFRARLRARLCRGKEGLHRAPTFVRQFGGYTHILLLFLSSTHYCPLFHPLLYEIYPLLTTLRPSKGGLKRQSLLQTWCGSAPRRGPSANGYDAWRLDPADPGARSLQLLLQTWCGSVPRRGPLGHGTTPILLGVPVLRTMLPQGVSVSLTADAAVFHSPVTPNAVRASRSLLHHTRCQPQPCPPLPRLLLLPLDAFSSSLTHVKPTTPVLVRCCTMPQGRVRRFSIPRDAK